MTKCDTSDSFDFARHIKSLIPRKCDRKYLIQCMYEMCEKSYRRGVQHAFEMPDHKILKKFGDSEKLSKWRFSPLNKSEGLCGYKTSSKERFFTENPVWECLEYD